MENIKSFLSRLPNRPGVYQMLGKKDRILYVGKARDLKKRLSSYFSSQKKDIKTTALLQHVHHIEVTVTQNEEEALLLECNLIKKHQPHYNVLFRDDKSYPYILLTEDAFPRIELYRGNKKIKGRYFGPYPNVSAVRETIHLIEKLFLIRTCGDRFYASRTRPCLQHQISRCTAPCVNFISKEEYKAQVDHTILFLEGKNTLLFNILEKQMEDASQALHFELAARIRDQIVKLRQIQKNQCVSHAEGNADVLGFAYSAGAACIQVISIRGGRILGSRAYFPSFPAGCSSEEIMTSFVTQHYLGSSKTPDHIPKAILCALKLEEEQWLSNVLSEQAGHSVRIAQPLRGERKKWLTLAENTAKQSIAIHLVNKANMQERFHALRQALHFKNPIHRVECFDVSHTQGNETVASCVVFNHNGPLKSEYRRFNITGITPGDDVAAIRQVITRRFKQREKEQIKAPDILLIDGGKAQLRAAIQALPEVMNTLFVGVSKGVHRKPGYETLHLSDGSSFHLSPDSLALHVIQQIRDEAHRFAITGHRQRRHKKQVTSLLETIPGIGHKRRRTLLKHFGGMQGLLEADGEALAKVPGISQSLAELIFSVLHK